MRNPFAAFKDPERRKRAWIWTAVIAIAVMAFYGVAQMATSTQWFCEEPCHNVHADNTRAFNTSSHSQISCIACHYRVEMDPISFALDRADKLIDIPPTIFGTFEMPMNEYSHMAFVMESTQCTQCHKIATTPFPPPEWQAVTFNQKTHDQHGRQGIACTICHNRVAHLETTPPTLPGNKNHEDFMTMKACFRCHSLTETSPSKDMTGGEGRSFVASGQCSVCHNRSFNLSPPSHDATAWPKAGHGTAAKGEARKTVEARAEWDKNKEKFYSKQPRLLAWLAGERMDITVKAPPVETIYECSTCHTKRFCDDCHATLKKKPVYDASQYW
jgi:hypothetical protein